METPVNKRLPAIDLLRGLVMVVMALDHVRDYFHADAFLFEPNDLDQASPWLFFTRWITHFCAPIFVLLAGAAAYLYGKKHTKPELARYLLSRGLWLVVLEVTVVNFAWYFNPTFEHQLLIVIWVIGASMMLLAAVIWLPLRFIAGLGLLMVFGHNMLDGFQLSGNGLGSILWAVLHQTGFFVFDGGSLFAAYPILPWTGVLWIGYAIGSWFAPGFPADLRKRWLNNTGYFAVLLFVLLRFTGIYGDPFVWVQYQEPLYTLLSFFNLTKYPPSLLYLLMTLGPALLLLAHWEKLASPKKWHAPFITIGRVPLFYYVVHLFIIHILALMAAEISGFGWQSMLLKGWVCYEPQLKGYGFSLGMVYLVWLGLLGILYPLSAYWLKFKSKHRGKWWVSYV